MTRAIHQVLIGVSLLLSASMARAADAPVVVPVGDDGVQRITMEMDNYSYSPSHIVVEAGKPVEISFVSVSAWTPHDFVIDDPAFGQKIEVNVGGGKKKSITFTPAAPGSFIFYCSKDIPFAKSHREKGMEGKIEVRAAGSSETP
jgi:plastocyanin